MTEISLKEKYAQSEVVHCWQNLSQAGLQQCEWEMVTRYFSEGVHVLDVGCGSGRAGLALEPAGFTVTGIDLSLAMLAAGRQLSATARFGGANLLALPFPDDTFEAVLMLFGALQHLRPQARRGQALAEMARVTKPGGRLIMGLDNLAPALLCYGYWLKEKLRPTPAGSLPAREATAVDTILWSRETRRLHPFLWHARGLGRSLRWRTWPGLIDLIRKLRLLPGHSQPGDVRVAQFSLKSTPGQIYYHLYRPEELAAEAAGAGWRLLAHHSGTELSQNRIYPPAIRSRDKLQFFAFVKE